MHTAPSAEHLLVVEAEVAGRLRGFDDYARSDLHLAGFADFVPRTVDDQVTTRHHDPFSDPNDAEVVLAGQDDTSRQAL